VITIVPVYPTLLSIYADRGNVRVLEQRCAWRGIEHRVQPLALGADLDPDSADIILLGGGQDRDQVLVAAELIRQTPHIRAAIDDGACLLAVCGGYQLLGHSYQLGEEKLPGLGIADLETVREPGPRLIGNVAIEADLGTGSRLIAGFENHGGRTYLGPGAQPLGEVVSGHGNNDRDGFEGVHRDNVIGTYLHGPLLPKNAWLADHLIALALERRYGTRPELEPLPDELEVAAHDSARRAAERS
jgi:lipid II isoglutaminyl synthase (glutamine-hydrolysing)